MVAGLAVVHKAMSEIVWPLQSMEAIFQNGPKKIFEKINFNWSKIITVGCWMIFLGEGVADRGSYFIYI